MKDQEKNLKKLGIIAITLNADAETEKGASNADVGKTATKIKNLKTALYGCNIVFTSPEAILLKYRDLLKDKTIGPLAAIVIDESHCVKKWGSSSAESEAFRMQYTNLAELRSLVPKSVPVVALTATATSETRQFIIDNLSLTSPQVFIASPGKQNIKFSIVQITDSSVELFLSPLLNEIRLKGYETNRVLIFCRLIKDMRYIYDVFETAIGERFQGFLRRPFAMFHSKTDETVKEHIMNQFTQNNGTVRVLIATIAFGMGVDCKQLNTILHFGPPASLEDYLQEAGRAGRDGTQSNAIIVVKPRSLSSKNIKDTMKNYVRNNVECRRNILLKEFGLSEERIIPLHNCCDICEKQCQCDCCESSEAWWERYQHPEKNTIINVSSPSDELKFEIRLRLSRYQESISFDEGQIPNDIICGFPKQCIDEIVDICHKDITADEIFNATSLLRRSHVENILLEIREVFELSDASQWEDEVYGDVLSESDGSESDTGNESEHSIDFHVNISLSDDE